MSPAGPVLLALAAAYGWGVTRARGWPPVRTAAWLGGLAVLAVALASGVDAGAERRLSVHMVQHVLLTMVAPVLLLAGAPVRLALRAGSPRARRAVAALLRTRALRTLAHPVSAWLAFAAVLLATHLTGLYAAALDHESLHAVEHAAYFWSAVLFWLPLAGAAPVPHRLGPIGALAHLMTAMAVMAVVGVALAGPDLRYPAYAPVARELGFSAVADQHVAAAIMLGTGGLAVLAATFGALWPALLREERHARARERLEGVRVDAEAT